LFANKYRIEKQLGKGGMGAVYLANQELLARRVAIKLLHMSSDEVTAARFQREARVIAQCQHPNIVNLIDFGEDDGRLYLVMEFIDGRSLTELLKAEAPFPARRVCDIGTQIAEALATAHDINIVHRDLKPDNIMVVTAAGRRDYVKILDFGVAKIKRDPSEGQVNTVETKAGLIVGSLRYISPEQVESREITTRTDMYSFGCVLYEMLAGRRVFDYPSPADCAIAHLTEPPKPPVVQGQTLEGPLVDFIMQCLEKKPERRPTNGRLAAQVLNACREQPLKTPPPSEMPTLALAESGGFAALQAANTMPTASPLPPLRQADASPSPRSQAVTSSAPPSAAAPAPASKPRPATGPDLQLRPARPTGAEGFAIVGGNDVAHTATHLEGVRLLPRAPVQPTRKKSLAWLWVLVALVVVGGVTALFVIQPWGSKVTAGGTSPTREAQADAIASEATSASPTTAAATATAPDAAPAATEPSADAAAAEEVAPTPDVEAEVAAVSTAGVEIVSVPDTADVTLAGRVVGKTPFTVQWGAGEPPPIVRISRKGYVDVDLQLVASDRGTLRRIELRPLDFR